MKTVKLGIGAVVLAAVVFLSGCSLFLESCDYDPYVWCSYDYPYHCADNGMCYTSRSYCESVSPCI
jgi:hypothetical protein